MSRVSLLLSCWYTIICLSKWPPLLFYPSIVTLDDIPGKNHLFIQHPTETCINLATGGHFPHCLPPPHTLVQPATCLIILPMHRISGWIHSPGNSATQPAHALRWTTALWQDHLQICKAVAIRPLKSIASPNTDAWFWSFSAYVCTRDLMLIAVYCDL